MTPNVQHVYFVYVIVTDESLKELAEIAPHLKSLRLESNENFDYNLGHMECFKAMTCLEYLSITGDTTAFVDPYPFVQFPPNLKCLTLFRIENTDQILCWVAKGCKDLKALSVIPYLSYADINENGCQAISQMKSLTYLQLRTVANNCDVGYIFEALTELRALAINIMDETVIKAITRHCKKLEHLSLRSKGEISPEAHANLLGLVTFPNLCSLGIRIRNHSTEQATKLINRLIANGKLQHIRISTAKKNPFEHYVPFEPDVLFEILRRCKNIQSIALEFGRVNSDFYSKICQVVDEIDEQQREQNEFTGETHPIVDVKYQNRSDWDLPAQYKWLRFGFDYSLSHESNVAEKWHSGWLTAGAP
ncbi:hypothetical protein Ddc_16731 [Ditylenchus destructor]|nr:hypothetical protein Ddc_16731 [Ditylenchus destructor]